MSRIAFTFALLLLFPLTGLAQTTWYVDDDNIAGPWDGSQANPFQCICDARDIALNGDIVLVLPGTYPENVNFLGKGISIKSVAGPEETTIAPGGGSVIKFNNGEGLDSVIDGFTIRSGGGSPSGDYGYAGGGIYAWDSEPTVINNIIKSNSAMSGGGIFCRGEYRYPRIENNVITDNFANYGGGIFCVRYAHPTIKSNIIKHNTSWSGGGINCKEGATPSISNNFIFNNSAGEGGGLWCYHPSFLIITNNTVVGNTADLKGGGLYMLNGPVEINNSILWGNSAAQGGGQIFKLSGSLTVNNSDIQGGWAGEGNINSDPLFVDAQNDDFHLTADSPCLEFGNNDASGIPLNDFDGDPRIFDGDLDGSNIVDIGADELFLPEVVARWGNVHSGFGHTCDVFFINNSIGSNYRLITVSPDETTTLRMDPPKAGPLWANFVLYAFPAEAGVNDLSEQPYGIGTFCFPTRLNGATPPEVYPIANNIGLRDVLGYPYFPSQPAPSTILDIPGGTLTPMTITLQGLIVDLGSSGPGISITNAIVLKVE